ncbi:DUF881 domain-containing protein [Bifidobacterium avesanii]|uniref:DUF881 domain-containing protein n=1 Tax=Bifidobacterium avesanii TaxID=1798157 RepID=A0A7K3TEE4_9BIFI|nr:DUF881 domain-containing protein [Bifidobacterium avesanii]KAB8295469.1 hypothetical protein DSM100685_0079 [Bifidobacterium avesanii]NEG77475.1 DUF881 domain-containing protein [Bifidobacterium avesanii]
MAGRNEHEHARDERRRDPQSTLRHQRRRDKVNDDTATGSFPVVRRKPASRNLDRNATRSRMVTSALVMVLCALLGYGYMVQAHNTQSSYESMTEDELRRLFTETSSQVSKLEDRKTQLTEQLNSIKSAVDKQEQARLIAQQNEQTSGILSGRLPAQGKGVTITIAERAGKPIDAATMFHLIEELRNAGAEVIEFAGVRVITSTSIQRVNGNLVCDGVTLTSPYVVKAIGDPSTLQGAVDIAGGVGSDLKLDFGAGVAVQQVDNVVIETVRQPQTNKYAKTVE